MAKFIIVDSVKGGCGKTVEALGAAIRESLNLREGSFEKYYNKLQHKGKYSEVCIIDMDLLGTSIEHTLMQQRFIRDSKVQCSEEGEVGLQRKADIYLNDLVDDGSNFKKQCASTFLADTHDGKCTFDLIIASPDEKDRHRFRTSSNSNYVKQITPTYFRGVLKKLIERLKDEYKVIIFDMPPNSDPYTDTVFELMLDINERLDKNKRKKDMVELEIVSTYDRAHIHANADWLAELFSGKDRRWQPLDEVRFILNDNMNVYSAIENRGSIDKDAIKSVILDKVVGGIGGFVISYRKYNGEFATHFILANLNSKIAPLDFKGMTAWYTLDEK